MCLEVNRSGLVALRRGPDTMAAFKSFVTRGGALYPHYGVGGYVSGWNILSPLVARYDPDRPRGFHLSLAYGRDSEKLIYRDPLFIPSGRSHSVKVAGFVVLFKRADVVAACGYNAVVANAFWIPPEAYRAAIEYGRRT